MSVPSVASVAPLDQAVGIVLGIPVVITFTTLINHATINGGTFSLRTASGVELISPEEAIQKIPKPVSSSQSIPGAFTFDDSLGYTVFTYTPSIPLQPNVLYHVLLMGAGTLINQTVKDPTGLVLDKSYTWSFTTGTLELSAPPVQSPMLFTRPDIDPTSILVTPRKFVVGQNLAQTIDLVFPGPIDQTSFDVEDILLSVEPILGDPSIVIPPNLQTTVTIAGNKISITISGWPQ